MGILDFDLSKITGNDAFMMGMGILGNNSGHYGAFAPALSGGLKDYQYQKARQIDLEKQKKQQQWMQQNMPSMVNAPAALQAEYYKSAFSKPDLPSGMRIGANGQPEYIPSYLEGQKQIKQAGKIDIYNGNPPMPTDDEIRRADLLANAERARGYVKGSIDQGNAATDSMANINKALKLLDTVETGTLEETKLGVQKFAKALGMEVDVSSIADAEQLMTLLGDEVMSRVAQTKGAVSEKEMDLFTRYSANFGNTVEGNRNILKFKLAKAQRDQKIAQIARDMMLKQNKSSVEIEMAILDFIEKNPITQHLIDAKPVQDEFDQLWNQ